eukprot:TRINITY_DN783_c0_g1_i9.p2 TRINITY_DN783_c0_g1~~TRINITY_DN783_c0_g1_i9.p2  ORF type:complete len:180 (-),score=23.32 TRINITY_DN783_c0_g1_i9:180-719(-)
MVVFLATVVRSKKRILDSIDSLSGYSWLPKVKEFFASRICQYTYQETAATFAVVHIPSCMPPVAGLSWVYATVERNRTVDNFLANTWAGQFALNKSAQDKHKRWEVDFWDNNVERGGDNYERGFNEDYYGNTVEDQYPLMNKDGSYYKVPTGGYSEVDLGKWLSTFDTGRDTGASSSRS